MKQMGLKAKIRAKKAYRHPAMGEISEHLLKRRFKARKPNEKWLTDVTELKGKDGKLYLSPILDLFNREIVAYAMSRRADSEMVKEMLEKAAPRLTDKGTMLHSDQGVLYRTAGYRELLAEHSMVQSMSRKANCWDNAPMESFFAVLKTECFYRAGELTVDELMKQIDGDLCKKALPPTAETQTQVFVYFRPPKSLLILPKYPLNPPRIPDNQASRPPFRQQQAHLAC